MYSQSQAKEATEYTHLCMCIYFLFGSALFHVVFLAEISLVICDKEEKAVALLENKENGTTPTLSCLVLFNDFTQRFATRAKDCNVEVLKLEQLMVSGVEVLNTRDADLFKIIPCLGLQ